MSSQQIPFREAMQRFRGNPHDVEATNALLAILRPLAHACARRLNANQVLESLQLADAALYALLLKNERDWDDQDEFLQLAWVVMRNLRIGDARRIRPDRVEHDANQQVDEPPGEWMLRLELILHQVRAIMALKKADPEASQVYRMREFGDAAAPITQSGIRLVLNYEGQAMTWPEISAWLGISRSRAIRRWKRALELLKQQIRDYDSSLVQ